MKKLAMIGTQIIHTYPYLAYFNGFDPERVQKNAKPWMAAMLKDKPSAPQSTAARFTHVWAGDPEEARRLAESCGIAHVAKTPHEFVSDVDGVFIMDEKIEERAGLMRPFLEAGKAVFVDKILSLDIRITEEFLSLAERKGAPLAAWSQLRFAPGLTEIKKMGRGGAALASFRLTMDILPFYSIHLISPILATFGTNISTIQKLTSPGAVEVRASYPDGTRVLMLLGPDVPPSLNLCYFAKTACRLMDTGDNYTMFMSAASALDKMLAEGEPPTPPEEIRRAAQLVQFILTASPGEERQFA